MTENEISKVKDLVAKVASGKVNVDEDLGVISAPVSSGSRALIEVARGLDEISIHPLDIGLKRPSLDDVLFLLLAMLQKRLRQLNQSEVESNVTCNRRCISHHKAPMVTAISSS